MMFPIEIVARGSRSDLCDKCRFGWVDPWGDNDPGGFRETLAAGTNCSNAELMDTSEQFTNCETKGTFSVFPD